ncbi:hypothetical protein FCM35_KLT15038 [Carex littledalei]|uniref:PUM-HD domain-containing protein n=1 Tax=Carex littledalei TaxID=544730 RepID=A0A833QER3_9POAL|nr:hypothetical protein FCM35_KLT15038 [Carex littledalei]
MSNLTSTMDVDELSNLLSNLSNFELSKDGELVEEEASDQIDSPYDSIFSNAAFSPPMLSYEERGNLQQLTNYAVESLKSRNPRMDDCIVDVIAPQLACLLAMPLSSGRCKTLVQLGSIRSPLERCKSGDISLELCEVIGHAEEFSFDQQGSQYLQEKLETATDEEKDTIFEEIIPIAMNLIIDVFGNFVIQKYLDYGSLAQIRELANILLGNVVKLAFHKHGCHVLQTALEVVDMDKRVSMAQELDGYVIRCSYDQHGSHVISKVIECVPEELIGFLISSLSNEITSLSAHPFACHVIQTLLECCDEESDRLVMLSNILQDVYTLSHDQYGNYVVQNGKPQERSAVIRTLAGKILEMSKHKFASNVIEKGLRFGGPQEQHLRVDEILTFTSGCFALQMMVNDQYGNYLVQTALEVY